MTIYPELIPSIGIGLVTALGLGLWGKAKQGCFTGALFLYVACGWCVSVAILVLGNPAFRPGFVLGFALGFLSVIWRVLSWFFSRLSEYRDNRAYEQRQRERVQRPPQDPHDTSAEQERQRRAEEAERKRQRNQQKPPPPPPETPTPPSTDTRTPYEILGVSSLASRDEINQAYRREAQRLHPDKWTGKPLAIRQEMEQEFKRVQKAYKRLT